MPVWGLSSTVSQAWLGCFEADVGTSAERARQAFGPVARPTGEREHQVQTLSVDFRCTVG